MKTNKILGLFMAAVALTFSSCEPIVDTAEITNTTDVDGVELVVTQSGPGGNLIELSMVTPGITGYWDYNIGRAFTDKVEFIYPIPGTQTFTYTGTLGKEFFTKSIDVQIDVLDNPLPADYTSLVSEDTAGGKTWVFGDSPWHMSPPDSNDGWGTIWWDAWSCCLADAGGKMKFDLDGAANYTYFSDANATGQTGTFALDIPNQTLVVSGAPILGGQDPVRLPGNGVFEIISLTEDELILHTTLTVGGDSGWTWRFVPE